MSADKHTRLCSVEGCGDKHFARGFCRAHYKRWRKVAYPEKVVDEARRAREKYRGKKVERQRAWRKANPGWTREWQKARRLADPERGREASRRWRRLNLEKTRAQERARRAARKTTSDKKPARTRANNPTKLASNHRYRAGKRGVESTLTAAEWLILLSMSPVCYWCGRPFNTRRGATHDHVLPLSRGGANTLQNSVCACFQCNTRKGSRFFNPVNGQGLLI
jgi:5-methylcytosine-specific restriction endonuclease McrA